MIVVENVHKHFGGFHAVDGASLSIAKGSITGLIGPNGAGKTTLFNVIAGVLKPTSGRITMEGEDITGLEPHELFGKGLLRTFQIAHEFSSMSCRENLMMVPPNQAGERLWNTWFQRGRIAEEEAALLKKADEVLDFLTIGHLKDEKAGNLSGGQKKLLELGRTMMVDARIVFLDEVGAGVNRTLLNTIGDAILRVLASWRHGKKLPPWAQPSAGHNAGGGFRVRKTKHPSSMPSSNQGPRRFGSPQLQARAASSAMSQLLHAVRIRVCFPMQLAGAPLKTAS